MTYENENPVQDTEQQPGDDVARGVTNHPRGTGDLDEDALSSGEDRLEQAAGGH